MAANESPVTSFTGRWSFLSNFARSPLALDGITYPTVEHAFQAQKTLDLVMRRAIAAAPSPAAAKRVGRRVQLREDWEEIKHRAMLDCLRLKFVDPELEELLASTGARPLVEGNYWHDNYWGDCRCERSGCRAPGDNMLGRLLMQLRSELHPPTCTEHTVAHRGKAP